MFAPSCYRRYRCTGPLKDKTGHGACSTYTSMCEPMMTVRSRGRLKYSAASAVM